MMTWGFVDAFIQHGIKGAALKQLNACRLFLQVETLSDIMSADGRYLLGWALDGTQGDPGRQEWTA